jgi:hypothetical protein
MSDDTVLALRVKLRIDQVTEDRGPGGAIVQQHIHFSKVAESGDHLASASLTLQITDRDSFGRISKGSEFYLELIRA